MYNGVIGSDEIIYNGADLSVASLNTFAQGRGRSLYVQELIDSGVTKSLRLNKDSANKIIDYIDLSSVDISTYSKAEMIKMAETLKQRIERGYLLRSSVAGSLPLPNDVSVVPDYQTQTMSITFGSKYLYRPSLMALNKKRRVSTGLKDIFAYLVHRNSSEKVIFGYWTSVENPNKILNITSSGDDYNYGYVVANTYSESTEDNFIYEIAQDFARQYKNIKIVLPNDWVAGGCSNRVSSFDVAGID